MAPGSNICITQYHFAERCSLTSNQVALVHSTSIYRWSNMPGLSVQVTSSFFTLNSAASNISAHAQAVQAFAVMHGLPTQVTVYFNRTAATEAHARAHAHPDTPVGGPLLLLGRSVTANLRQQCLCVFS